MVIFVVWLFIQTVVAFIHQHVVVDICLNYHVLYWMVVQLADSLIMNHLAGMLCTWIPGVLGEFEKMWFRRLSWAY